MVDLAAIGRPCTLPREGPLWANEANDLTAKEIREMVDLDAIGRPCVLPTFEPQRGATNNPTLRSSRASTIFFFTKSPPQWRWYERDALMTRITAFADAIPKMECNSQSGIIMPLRTMVMWEVYGAVVWARSARASSKARIADFRRESALRS
jgi:hypothetical protein